MAGESGESLARSRALSVLRIRGTALAVAMLPAAVAVILLVGGATGRIVGSTSEAVRLLVVGGALLVLLLAAAVAAVIVRARPAVSPTVPVAEAAAPDLYRLVRDLAARLQVPSPSAIELTPDCDSWLEDRTHPARRSRRGTGRLRRRAAPGRGGGGGGGADTLLAEGPREVPMTFRPPRRRQQAPVLVIGSPFMWWMRVAELRALLAPVVAGTGPSADPDIAAARRFVRGLDAAVAIAAARGGSPRAAGLGALIMASPGATGRPRAGGLRAVGDLARCPAYAFLGWVARLLLRSCRDHAAEMERAVASSASQRAQAVDYGLRIVAQEQVGLAYAGWDRLLTRVALPAWRMGRWPSQLDAGVVAALTELSRRDRLAEGFESRLGERPACDLLEEPGTLDEAASLLAARLFHGGPARPGPGWSPVDWETYPEEVVDRIWRSEAARLIRVLDEVRPPPSEVGPPARPGGRQTSDRAVTATAEVAIDRPAQSRPRTSLLMSGQSIPLGVPASAVPSAVAPSDESPLTPPVGVSPAGQAEEPPGRATLARVLDRLSAAGNEELAARITGQVVREEEAARAAADHDAAGTAATPVYQLLPPRTGRELLTDHVTAMVCCAAMDTAGATPGLDWLDGPALLVNGSRRGDLSWPVLRLVENGDAAPLRSWLATVGVRLEKPVRLV
jgi:hypothetical protein